MGIILEVKKLSKHFGGLVALDNIDFKINEGEIFSIIGPNGAGKSTCFNCLVGVSPATSGNVYLNTGNGQEDITFLRTDEVVKKGIARTFQNIRLFSNLSVLDNIKIGQHIHMKSNFLNIITHSSKHKSEESRITDECLKYLKMLELTINYLELASNQPYGIQKRIEIARALASKPKLLLLDEPAAGLNANETKKLMELIKNIRDSGVTIILIEHDMKMVMNISDRILVLDYGKKIAEGLPDEIQKNPAVIEAYLGKEFLDA